MLVTVTVRAADGATQQIQVDVPVADPTWNPPTGTGFVRYQDLYKSGDTLNAALARMSNTSKNWDAKAQTAKIVMPEGYFEVTDFKGVPSVPTVPYAIHLPDACSGLIGSGKGVMGSKDSGTVFGIKANSSSFAKQPQDGSTPNKAALVFHQGGAPKGTPHLYEQFQLIGPAESSDYNMLDIYKPTGPETIQDILVYGGQGSASAPPGETFGVAAGGANGPHLIQRVEIDGIGALAVGITMGNSLNGVIRDCTIRHCRAASLVIFQAFGTQTFDVLLDSAQNSVNLGQPSVNHERSGGTVHTRLMQTGTLAGQGVNITHSNDTYTATIDGAACSTVDGSLTFVDCDLPATSKDGYPQVQSWSPYSNGDTMKTAPVMRRSDGTRVPFKWLHGASAQLVS